MIQISDHAHPIARLFTLYPTLVSSRRACFVRVILVVVGVSIPWFFTEASQVETSVQCGTQLRRGLDTKAQKQPARSDFVAVPLEKNQGQIHFDFPATDPAGRLSYTVRLHLRLLPQASRWLDSGDKLEVSAALYKKGEIVPEAMQIGHSDMILSPVMLEWATGQKKFKGQQIAKAVLLMAVPATLGRVQKSTHPVVQKIMADHGVELAVDVAAQNHVIGADEASFVDVVCMIAK